MPDMVVIDFIALEKNWYAIMIVIFSTCYLYLTYNYLTVNPLYYKSIMLVHLFLYPNIASAQISLYSSYVLFTMTLVASIQSTNTLTMAGSKKQLLFID